MITLRIEHPITDYTVWKRAFDRFSDERRIAGVSSHRVRNPVDDPRYVVIDLDFATAQQAGAFLDVLRTRVWANPASSPALAGEPRTQILETLDAG